MAQAQNHYGLIGAKSNSSMLWKRFIWFPAFMLFFAILGMWVAGQYAAARTGYHAALGCGIASLWGYPIYLPWSFLTWQQILPVNILEAALRVGILTFAIPHIVFFLIILNFYGKPKGLQDLHGSARWATFEEIKNMGLLENIGVYIGGFFEKAKSIIHYLTHNGPEHILVFAPTRSGKGVGLILPTLLSWFGSLFCLDIKGENWALTAGFRKYILRHKVFRFDPTDTSGKGARYNPLQEIRLTSPKAISDTQNIATFLVDPLGKGLDDYWAKAGFSFMSGALLHCVIKMRYQEKRHANLGDFIYALSDEDSDIQAYLDEMLESDHAEWFKELFPDIPVHLGQDIHQFIASGAREMKSKAENEASGVINTAMANLSLYRDPIVRNNISTSDFMIDDLMDYEVPIDVYLVTPPSDTERLTPLIRLVTSLVLSRRVEKMEFAEGRSVTGYKHRLLMMLDEFTAIGKLQIVEKAIAFCAGYGIKLYLIVQDVAQLNGVYGKDSGLMANCHVRIAYATNNPETSKLLSEMAGKTTVVQQKNSLSGTRGSTKKSNSVNIQETARNLLTPDECSRLPGAKKNSKGQVTEPGDMLIFIAGQPPIYGKQILYFKDAEFIKRAQIEPPEKSDSIYFAAAEPEPLEQPVPQPIQQAKFTDFL